MECPVCKRAMVVLFLSAVCEHCEDGPREQIHLGYVIWPNNATEGSKNVCIFMTEAEAAIWMGHNIFNHTGSRVRVVGSLSPYKWTTFDHQILGPINFAIGGYEIFLDHRYEPREHRAFLIPGS